jgi:hypothetical protein
MVQIIFNFCEVVLIKLIINGMPERFESSIGSIGSIVQRV